MRGIARWAGTRRLTVLMACCVAGLVSLPSVVRGESQSPVTGADTSLSLDGSPLVVQGVQALDGGQQLGAAEEARRSSPEAVTAREESRTKYESLGAEQAARVAGEAFPVVIDEPAGGPPRLPAGQSITGFPTDDVAQVELPGGRHGVIESMEPFAVETSLGHREPVDLSLEEVGGAFQPVRSDMALRIPKRLSDGVQLASTGVSLTPVAGNGSVLGGSEGVVDGASVLYANTQADADTVVKPSAVGFETSTVLRSVNSPQQVSFRVGLPDGGSLVQAGDGSGVVRVMDHGVLLATVLEPVAQDAAGRRVPVVMDVSGDTLVLSVDEGSGEYEFPIDVDPTVVDSQKLFTRNWGFGTNNSSAFSASENIIEGDILVEGHSEVEVTEGQFAYLDYYTQGQSHIYKFVAETSQKSWRTQSSLSIASPVNGNEGGRVILPSEGSGTNETCAGTGCVTGTVTTGDESNRAFYEQLATSTYKGVNVDDRLWNSSVSILQEQHPYAAIDTTEASLEGRPNAGYPGTWVTTASTSRALRGMIGLRGLDQGIGINREGLSIWHSGSGWEEFVMHDEYFESGSSQNGCSGMQCNECDETECIGKVKGKPLSMVLNHALPEGEDMIKGKVEDFAGLSGVSTEQTIKVDNAAPTGISVSGLPGSGEINERPYGLSVQATDGSGTTPSSGVKSIALFVGGREIGKSTGSCSPGPCTGSGEIMFSAEGIGAGKRILDVVATDKAGNVATREYTIFVRHPAPVAVGPASVNPTTGQAMLSASDVTIPVVGGSLTVSRSYASRQLLAGAEGPMGPLWSLSLSGVEQLVVSPGVGVSLVAANGSTSTFASNGKGGFESSKANENLVLSEVKEGEKTKEYLLKNGASATTTHFTLPSGSEAGAPWKPTVAEGPVATDTMTYTYTAVEVESGKKIIEPTEELAPVPAGVSCAPKLERGCRALQFSYAETTTSKGEGSGEWGDFAGRLKRVYFVGWDPSKSAMSETAVAQYEYDAKGRLRAEWDPRVSPALKKTYGYDSEGHVTAVSDAGQQPWLFGYGTSPTDSTSGRLLSVTRPAASTALGNGIAPLNTVAPTLSSSTPAVGSKISVSSAGTWSNSPLAFSYQWEDCNSAGNECTVIPGAVNHSYYPAKSDEGHTLRSIVSASNATGLVTASSAATSTVATGTAYNPAPEPPSVGSNAVWTIEYQVPVSGEGAPYGMGSKEVEGWGEKDDPSEAMALFPPDEPMGWPAANYKRATTHYLDAAGRAVNLATPNGGISTSEYNETNDMVRSLTADNRATALKESGKSAEVAKSLDTQSVYNKEGNQLLETLGPEHKIKLAAGGEVQARDHVRYSYNEGAPEGGPYNLVTKTIDGAKVVGKGEEADVRVTKTSYSGQENLGWKLRKPTSVTTDPTNGLKGSVTSVFGSLGTGNGQFNNPGAVAIAGNGNVYVADTKNSRIQEFSPSGEYIVQFGAKGSGSGELNEPLGVAVAESGNVFVANTGGKKVDEYTAKGEYVRAFSSGRVLGVAVSSGNNVYVLKGESLNAVYEYTESGTSIRNFGRTTEGSGGKAEVIVGPRSIAVSPRHNEVYVTETGKNEESEVKESALVKIFTEEGHYDEGYGAEGAGNGQFKEPAGIAVASSGYVYIADSGNNRVQELNEKGGYLAQYGTEGANSGQLNRPAGVALASNGNIYVADAANNRIEVWGETPSSGLNLVHTIVYDAGTGNVTETRTPSAGPQQAEGSYIYAFKSAFGALGSGTGQFNQPGAVAVAANGNVYVSDTKNSRVEELTPAGEYITQFGVKGSGSGELKEPEGIAVAKNGNVFVANTGGKKLDEFTENGEYVRAFSSGNVIAVAVSSVNNVYVLKTATSNAVYEYTETGTSIRNFGRTTEGSGGKAEVIVGPRSITVSPRHNEVYVTETGKSEESEVKESSLVKIFEEEGRYVTEGKIGSEGSGNGQFKEPDGIAVAPDGYMYIADSGNSRVQVLNAKNEYVAQYGTKGSGAGQLTSPAGVALAPNGYMYIADTANNRIERWTAPGEHGIPNQTIYYSAGSNSIHPACGEHAEWANLPCLTQPSIQPEGGLPRLPITTSTYNIWDEPEKTSETATSATRSTTIAYDTAGRTISKETTSSTGVALPKVTYKYNTETGVQKVQSTTSEGKTKAITTIYNSLGQLTSYTDANENTTSYEYDVDGRIHKINDSKGIETYTYNETTGFPTEMVNEYGTAKLTFTATYDAEGNMLTEGYPNGMTANYAYNQVGAPTSLEYLKTTHCTEKCAWFTDTAVPSIHGQWLEQISTLSHQNYTYDASGRLTQVQNTPASKGCTTRLYAYDEDTNRTSLTIREPNTKGECATEGGTVEKHTYDEADRLNDTGTTYNAFGDITALPAADAEKSELTSTYYSDNQLQSQTQNGETIGYNLDPAGRTNETIATGKHIANITNHYAGPADTPIWTANTSGETTRNIAGIDGKLAATQSNTETPVLQLTNLHGDIIATAYLSETATGLASSADTSEFGVPTTSLPPKYSWLGALDLPTELSSGVVAMGARSYVPQIGRFLQPDPQPGGSANAYTYTFGDPVNTTDPSGEYTIGEHEESWVTTYIGQNAATAVQEARRAAEEAAARAEAERIAQEAAYWASMAGPQDTGLWGEEWEEEEWYEEEEYEYAAYHHGGEDGKGEAHAEVATLDEKGANFGPGVATPAEGTSVVPICTHALEANNVPCGRNASIFGKAWRWVKKHAKHLVAAGVSFVTGAALGVGTVFATAACFDGTDGAESLECLHIAQAGGAASAGAFAAGVGALSSELHEWF